MPRFVSILLTALVLLLGLGFPARAGFTGGVRFSVLVTPLADGHSFAIAGPRGFSAEVTGNRYGLTGLDGSAGGKTFDAAVTRNPQGEVSQVAVNPPGPLGTFTTGFSASGRPVSLSGPGVNLGMTYDFSGGGVKVTGTDASSGKDFLTENDAEGIARRREATGKNAFAWDGNPLAGTSGMTAAGFTDQKVETTYGPALLPLERTRSDGSGVSYVWNADGSLASFTEFDGPDNGGAARTFTVTRDADGRENGYTSADLTVARTWNLDGTLAAVSHQTKDADGNTLNYQASYPSWFDDQPLVETFGGPLAGYEIRRNYDAETGEAVRVELRKNGQPVHAVDYARDAVGRFSTIATSGGAGGGSLLQAEYTYPSDLEEKLTWPGGNTLRTLAGDGMGTLGSIATITDAGENYSASYSFTGTRRTGAEISIHGLGLAKWNYGFTNPATGTGSLQSAVLNNAPRFSYAQNAAGNRVSGAANIANQYAIAAQPGARFYSVAGSVKPGATVKISRTGGPTVAVPTAADGKFTARLPVPEDGTNPVKIPLTVTGTLPGAGDDGTDAIADDKRMIVLTPAEMPLTYGVHGSLVGDWRWTYHWDIEGRLAGMNTNPVARNAGMPNLTLRFSYDDIGRRIGKSVVHRKRVGTALVVTRTVTSSYVYDNWKLIAEEINDTAASGPVTRYYTWGKDIAGSLDATGGVGGLLAIHENGATYVPVYDGSGNIIALVDAQTGAQLAAWKRGPFGEPLEKRGDTSLCPFGFATHFTDEETGLVYFGYRYYSPVTGRWLSREPLGETESFNLFDYCHGDPVNKVDRIGLDEVTITNGEASYNFVDEVNGARGGWLKKFLDHVFHAKFDESKREFFGSVSLGSVSGGNVTLANGVSVPLSDLQTMADKRAMGRLDRCEQIRLLANDLNSWISRNEGAAAAGLIGTADKIVSAPFQALAGPDALTILGGIADKHDGFSFGVDLDSRNYARGVHLGSEIDDGIQIAGMAMILNPKNVSTFVRGASAAKNATRKVSVLGTYLPHNGKTYVQFAAEIGARRFALPDDKFLKMAQRAETIHGNPLYYNKLYLDSIANHGDLVRLNISRPEMQAIIGSNPNAFKTLRWEIGDLLSRGYTWGNDLKSLIPPAR